MSRPPSPGAPAPAGQAAGEPRHDVSRLTEQDLYLFNEGTHYRLFEKLGSHVMTVDGVSGTYFAVWAPAGGSVSVAGSFNGWDARRHPLRAAGSSGIWEAFVPGVGPRALYKYIIRSRLGGAPMEKADPFARLNEVPPRTASIVWEPAHEWGDREWMQGRGARHRLASPLSLYEVHAGSWKRPLGRTENHLSWQIGRAHV